MAELYIYHPKTGTLIPLSEQVFLVNVEHAGRDTINDLSEGVPVPEREHKGWRIDNYNMGNLFYGS